MLTILLLGGTSEAKVIAKQLLIIESIYLIYSVVGLVRQPQLDCKIHTGGFQGNMQDYLQQQKIELVIDATHPYAEHISQQAMDATQHLKIPYWQYNRPAWQASAKDHWLSFNNWQTLHAQLQSYQRPFFTLGREPLQHLQHIPVQQHWTVRTAIHYDIQHPQLTLIQAIGGFSYQEESHLFEQHVFDVLICKNSGGTAVASKLQLAQQLHLPVLMQSRPTQIQGQHCFFEVEQLLQALLAQFKY
jgi:precorrin-6A/cobalt-precorrin-6A reductase